MNEQEWLVRHEAILEQMRIYKDLIRVDKDMLSLATREKQSKDEIQKATEVLKRRQTLYQKTLAAFREHRKYHALHKKEWK